MPTMPDFESMAIEADQNAEIALSTLVAECWRDMARGYRLLNGTHLQGVEPLSHAGERGQDGRPDWEASDLQLTGLGGFVSVGPHGRLLTEIVDSLAHGTQFLALTGPPGVGKTIMATTISERLRQQSVNVRYIGGGRGGIHLRTIMFQILGKPESDADGGEIEQLFNAMTRQEVPGQKLALIIDDAELLLPDAIGYLRLLASVAMEQMPQIVFVGKPSFWDIASQASFEDLITSRFELGPITENQTRVVAQRLMSALSIECRPTFDIDALDALASRTDGLIGRLVPLVVAIEAVATEAHQTRVTGGLIDSALARLETGTDSMRQLPACDSEAAITGPVAVYQAPEDGGAALYTHSRRRSIAQLMGAAALVFCGIGFAAYWLFPSGTNRMWAEARTTVEEQDVKRTASPAPTVMVQAPAGTPEPQARPDFAKSDDAIAPQAVAPVVASGIGKLPPAFLPQAGIAISAYGPAPRTRAVRARSASSGGYRAPVKGIWLFPSNASGGANG